jgi:hypothetical protein
MGEQPSEEWNSGGGVVEPDEVMEQRVHPSPRSELVESSHAQHPILLPAPQQRAQVRLIRLQRDTTQNGAELMELLLAASCEARNQGAAETSVYHGEHSVITLDNVREESQQLIRL